MSGKLSETEPWSNKPSPEFPVSIKGVMFQDHTIVLLENERAEWELPGGRLEPDEPPEACLARERRVGVRCRGRPVA